MKAKWIGLLLLIVVALGAVGYVWFSQSTQVTEITGYVGGEKIGLLEDEQVQKILKDKYPPVPGLQPGGLHRDGDHPGPHRPGFPVPLQPDSPGAVRGGGVALPKRARLSSTPPSCCTPTPPWRRR